MSWRLEAPNCALLVIDVQAKLVPVIAGAETLIRKLVLAVAVARQFGLPVHFTEQAPEKLGSTIPELEDAAGSIPLSVRQDLAFSKAGCFADGELPPTVLVAGIETHVCIRQTVFDLRERGHDVRVLADATGSRAERDHSLALHELREIARARVTTVETLAWELLGRAEGDGLRALLRLVK